MKNSSENQDWVLALGTTHDDTKPYIALTTSLWTSAAKYPEERNVGSHSSIDSLCQEQRIQMQNIVILIPVLAIQPHISMNATYLRFS